MALVLKPRTGRSPKEPGATKPRKRVLTKTVIVDGVETKIPLRKRVRKPEVVVVEDRIDHEAVAAEQAATDIENARPRQFRFTSRYSCFFNGSLLVYEPTRTYVLDSRLANYLIMGDAPIEEVK